MRGNYERKEAVNPRNINDVNNKACDTFYEKLNSESFSNKQYALEDVRINLPFYLPSDVPAYSTKHLKRKIIERYGDEVNTSKEGGVADVITFKTNASNILRESYLNESVVCNEQTEENIKMAISLGKIISSDLEEVSTSAEYYPSFTEVDLQQLSSGVPSTLSSFLSCYILSRSDSA